VDLTGKTLGNYQIMEEVGLGGMAVVYRAYQASLNRYVALKVLPPQLAFDSQFVERFLREARAAASLNHPNIVVVHDFV
jgi:serine/threonine protein kinase